MSNTQEETTSYPGMVLPVRLFRPDENHSRLIVVPETLKLLEQIKKPVVLVTIVGTQRGGKSTLLYLLHSRRTSGSGLAHYMDPQTTGLWIWARDHPRDPDLTVLLMDTEGLDSPHIPQWYNWTLSALALVISSYFIYQTKGSIDSNAIDRLGVILKVAEQLGGDSGTDKPNFLWLIRDHQLQLKKSPKVEMTDKLEPSHLKALQQCFADYDCALLPRPVDKDELLKEVENMKWEELRGEFREEYAVLERQIFTAVSSPRHLSGSIINGEVMSNIIEKYGAAVNAKDGIFTELSQLPTQHEMVVRMAGERAVKHAVQKYNELIKEVKNRLPVEQSHLEAAHNAAYQEALQVFNSMMDKDSGGYYLEELQKRVSEWSDGILESSGDCIQISKLVGGAYYELWKENVQLSKEKCTKELASLFADIAKKLENPAQHYSSIQQFEKEVASVKESYLQSKDAVGMAKQATWDEFFKPQHEVRVQTALVRRELEEQKKEHASQIAKLHDLLLQQQTDMKAMEERGKLFENQIHQFTQSLKNLTEQQVATATSVKELEQRERTTNEKIATTQEQLHKLEVPIALNTQSIAALQPKIDNLEKEAKKLPLLESKVESNEANTQQRFDRVDEKQQEVEKKLDTKITAVTSALDQSLGEQVTRVKTLEASMNDHIEKNRKWVETNEEKWRLGLGDLEKRVSEKVETVKQYVGSVEEKWKVQVKSEMEGIQAWCNKHVKKEIGSVDEKLTVVCTQLAASIDTTSEQAKTNTKHIQQNGQVLEKVQGSLQQWEKQLNESERRSIEQFAHVELRLQEHDRTNEAMHTRIAELAEEAKRNVDYLNEHILQLQENIKMAGQSWESNQQNLASTMDTTHHLVKTVQEYQEQHQVQASTIIALEQQLQQLSSTSAMNVEAIDNKLTTLASQLEDVNEVVKRKAGELEDAGQQVQGLRQSLFQLEDKTRNILQWKEQLDQLDSDLQVTRETVSKDSKDLQQFTLTRLEELKRYCERTVTDLKLKNDESVQRVATRCTANEATLEGHRKTLEQLQQGLEHNGSNKLESIAQIEKQLAGLQGDLKKLEKLSTTSEELKKNYEYTKQSVDALWESLGVLSGRIFAAT